MEIKQPDPYKEVVEYVFVFSSGMEMSFILDEQAGDYCKDVGEEYIIHLGPKPSFVDPDEMIPPEQIRVYKNNLAVRHVRTRRQRVPTPEEIFEMQKTLHKEPKTVQ